jgi:acyl carrier protein
MLFETVRECLVSALDLTSEEALRVDQNTTAANLKKWDSAGHFMLIAELEERFGIQFEDEETVQLGSVPAILKSVASKQ